MDLMTLVAKLTLDSSDYDKGLGQAEKSGKGFGGKLSKAFGTVTKAGAALGGAAVAAGTAIAGVAMKSANTSDHIDKMSQKIGLSREAYQELDFICSQSGANVDNLRVGMKTLTNQMGKAAEGTGNAADIFKRLGVSIYDSNGNLKDQETMLYDTLDALQGVENQTERATLANQLFGRSGSDLMPLINGARGSIAGMRDEAHSLGLVLSDETIDAGVKLTDTIDKSKRAFDAIVTTVGAQVMPLVQKLLEFVLEHMPEIQSMLSTVMTALSGYVTTFVNLVNTYVMPTINSIITFLRDVFAGDWSAAWEDIKGIFTTAWEGITTFFTDMFNNAVTYIKEIDWLDVGNHIWDTIISAFSNIWEWAQEKFGFLADTIKTIDWLEVGNHIWDTLISAFNGIATWAKEKMEFLGDRLKKVDDADFWSKTGSGIWELLKKGFADITGWGKKVAERIKTGLDSLNWHDIGEAIWEKLKEFAGILTSTDNPIITFGTDLGEKIRDGIASINWLQLGKDLWGKIKEGVLAVDKEGLATVNFGNWLGGKIREGIWGDENATVWSEAGKGISNKFKEGWGYLSGGVNTVLQWGKDLSGEIISGIENSSWWQAGNNAWEKIKTGFMNVTKFFEGIFDFTNIHIKMPHFTVTSWKSFGPISVPWNWEWEWRAKGYENPLLFTSLGNIGNNIFGDRGSYNGGELVYSHDKLMDDIREATGSGARNITIYVTQRDGEDSMALAERLSEIMADDYDYSRGDGVVYA